MPSNMNHFDHQEEVQQQQQQMKQPDFHKTFLNKTEIDSSIYMHPTLLDYYNNLTPFITLSIIVAALLMILTISIFCTTVSWLKRHVNVCYRKHTIFLCSLYPIISCAALTTILLPKVWLICHTVMHLSFVIGAVIFHQLCFRYVNSETSYLKETDRAAVAINTPPCCCCCFCLPLLVPSKGKFCLLRYMVWQAPFVQGAIMLVLNVIYYRTQDFYYSVSLYFTPFIVCSIVIVFWGLNITARIVSIIHSKHNLKKKLFCLQLIMILCKLQYLLLDSQLNHFELGDKYPINHTIHKQTIINLLILGEMVLVSILVKNAYKVPT